MRIALLEENLNYFLFYRALVAKFLIECITHRHYAIGEFGTKGQVLQIFVRHFILAIIGCLLTAMKSMTTNIVPMLILLVGVMLLTTFATSAMTPLLQYAAAAGTEFSDNQNFPVSIAIFAPCLGEQVLLTGTLHDVFAIRTDNAGGFSLTSHFNYHDVKGVGQTTGEIYRWTGAFQNVLHGKVGLESTIAGHNNLISQGGGSNLVATQILHFRLNPNGDVTVNLVKFNVECKG